MGWTDSIDLEAFVNAGPKEEKKGWTDGIDLESFVNKASTQPESQDEGSPYAESAGQSKVVAGKYSGQTNPRDYRRSKKMAISMVNKVRPVERYVSPPPEMARAIQQASNPVAYGIGSVLEKVTGEPSSLTGYRKSDYEKLKQAGLDIEQRTMAGAERGMSLLGRGLSAMVKPAQAVQGALYSQAQQAGRPTPSTLEDWSSWGGPARELWNDTAEGWRGPERAGGEEGSFGRVLKQRDANMAQRFGVDPARVEAERSPAYLTARDVGGSAGDILADPWNLAGSGAGRAIAKGALQVGRRVPGIAQGIRGAEIGAEAVSQAAKRTLGPKFSHMGPMVKFEGKGKGAADISNRAEAVKEIAHAKDQLLSDFVPDAYRAAHEKNWLRIADPEKRAEIRNLFESRGSKAVGEWGEMSPLELDVIHRAEKLTDNLAAKAIKTGDLKPEQLRVGQQERLYGEAAQDLTSNQPYNYAHHMVYAERPKEKLVRTLGGKDVRSMLEQKPWPKANQAEKIAHGGDKPWKSRDMMDALNEERAKTGVRGSETPRPDTVEGAQLAHSDLGRTPENGPLRVFEEDPLVSEAAGAHAMARKVERSKFEKNAIGILEKRGFARPLPKELTGTAKLNVMNDLHLVEYAAKDGTAYGVPEELVGLFKQLDDTDKLSFIPRAMQKFNSVWKPYVLSTPGFHLRNAQTNEISNLIEYGATMLSPKLRSAAWKKSIGRDMGKKIGLPNGDSISLREVDHLMKKNGLSSPDIIGIDDIMKKNKVPGGEIPVWDKLKKVTEFLRNVGQRIEEYHKTMAFLAGLEGRAPNQIMKAIERANKAMLNYGHLSKEEMVLRQFIPFYTWTRKNVPKMYKTLAERPQAFSQLERFNQGGEGYEGQPEFAREVGGRVMPKGFPAAEGNRATWLLENPMRDVRRFDITDPEKLGANAAQMMSPMASVLAEMGMGGERRISGKEIKRDAEGNIDWGDYLKPNMSGPGALLSNLGNTAGAILRSPGGQTPESLALNRVQNPVAHTLGEAYEYLSGEPTSLKGGDSPFAALTPDQWQNLFRSVAQIFGQKYYSYQPEMQQKREFDKLGKRAVKVRRTHEKTARGE